MNQDPAVVVPEQYSAVPAGSLPRLRSINQPRQGPVFMGAYAVSVYLTLVLEWLGRQVR
jgi:hypothetical protein